MQMQDLPTDPIVATWVAIVRASNGIIAGVTADAKAAGLPPLEWYDVLWDLERHAEGVRPFELEERLLFAQYNLSRLIERLVEAGLVRREVCPTDKRGQMLFITDAGKKARKATWPHYARAVNQHLGDKLNEAETEKLAALLGKLIEK